MSAGSLTVIGTGIKFGGHLTPEARGWLNRADRVIFGFADAVSQAWIDSVVDDAEPVSYYRSGRPRKETYDAWVEELLEPVRAGHRVCAVFYGHPGVYVFASHEAVHRARKEGYAAHMLPGISAEDCLIADLGVDPAHHGWVSYEATDFLVRRRPLNVHSGLVLWQIGLAGRLDYAGEDADAPGLPLLVEVLAEAYGAEHEVTVYEAAQFAIYDPICREVRLGVLSQSDVTPFSTLYVPPLELAPVDPERVEQLGLTLEDVERTRRGLSLSAGL